MENAVDEIRSEEVLRLASEAGRILLQNGAEISRVEDTMERIASHYGVQGENFFVLSNGIFTTGRSYANAQFIQASLGTIRGRRNRMRRILHHLRRRSG